MLLNNLYKTFEDEQENKANDVIKPKKTFFNQNYANY